MSGMLPADALALGIGAFFGALSRYQVGQMAAKYIASDPKQYGKLTGWHTAGINVAGSFLLGGISATPSIDMSKVNGSQATSFNSRRLLPSIQGMSPRTKLMMGVGFCGSFTTFSTFSVDVVNWINQGKTVQAMSYVATNNIGGIIAAGIGMAMVKKFFG
ncbi:CrcB-like domain containing protein [Nitzschia inconspicua]|uniref:CrcB-like domain containing protein n=1 Tax=Nitzschia inconspicua TaxID=303405 RepID=A0A9K3KCU4_9STRA|nr:CrcB-like domain containing protein [Nitzschia inconspicua]